VRAIAVDLEHGAGTIESPDRSVCLSRVHAIGPIHRRKADGGLRDPPKTYSTTAGSPPKPNGARPASADPTARTWPPTRWSNYSPRTTPLDPDNRKVGPRSRGKQAAQPARESSDRAPVCFGRSTRSIRRSFESRFWDGWCHQPSQNVAQKTVSSGARTGQRHRRWRTGGTAPGLVDF
jgi:hypothetical protein